MVRVRLSDDCYAWLCDAAAEHKPPLSTDELLRQLIDQAIAEGKAAVLRRAEQFELCASGYAEHHPDYPDFPGGLPDESATRDGLRVPWGALTAAPERRGAVVA